MPVEDFLKVIDDITPYVEPNKVLVIFTGGEALVRKDIEKCGLELYRRGYPWGIVSNGYLMTRERLDSLLASGLHSATISLMVSRKRITGFAVILKKFREGTECHLYVGRGKGDHLGCGDLRKPTQLQGFDALQAIF